METPLPEHPKVAWEGVKRVPRAGWFHDPRASRSLLQQARPSAVQADGFCSRWSLSRRASSMAREVLSSTGASGFRRKQASAVLMCTNAVSMLAPVQCCSVTAATDIFATLFLFFLSK